MTFVWSDYLALAEQILQPVIQLTVPDEARQRCAVSRAYYAAFITARNFVRDKYQHEYSSSEVHQRLPDWFMGRPEVDARQIGQDLMRLRKDRNKVDYHDEVAALKNTTESSLLLSRQIIEILGRL